MFVAYVITEVISYVFKILKEKFTDAEHPSNATIFLTVKNPLIMYVWIVCAYDIVEIASLEEIQILNSLEIVLVSFVLLWLVVSVTDEYTKKIIYRKQCKKEIVDYGGIVFLERLVQFLIFILVALFAMSGLGVSLSGLLTIGGIGGLAVSLAARDMIANIFGSILIYIDKPFAIGDWVNSPDKKIEGIVEDIGWRRTVILSLSKYPIYVPNSLFNSIVVENKGRMRCRQIDEIIPVRMMDISKIDKITSEIREMLLNDSNISRKGFILVYFESVARPSVLNLRVLAFTSAVDLPRYSETKQSVLMRAINIVKENGGELAYDVAHVTICNNPGETNIFSEKI
ncbi:MAG: mechanosensitive ion channel family protein [Rickettsiales bacterium]|jgi:MscS family membrane protein|nr:mechanosensitive ion channel family protein [Rickettsiales bacterium]